MSDMLENETQPAMQTPGSGVRFALEATPTLDAQKAARISQLAKSLGLPENFVIENPRKAEMEVTARKLESNQMLAAWASEDRLNLALAKDDPALGEAMGIGETIGHVWDRETDALQKGWERGEGQRQTSRMGNRYLEAIGRGDYDAAAKIQADADALQKSLNPLWEQETFGLLKPGNLPAISQPLRPQPAKEYPPDKPLQAELDALFADTRIVDTSAGPLQQELDDLFSSPPHVYAIDGKAVLLPSLDENGKPVSLEQAAEKFQQTGQHAGIFSSREHALGFLSQKPDRQREIAANWREKPEDTWVSAIGLDYALDQLPRMLFDQLPTQANRAAWGAAGGFAVGGGTALALGQAGPQVLLPEEIVTVPAAAITGATIGGRTGWIVGAGESAFYSERGAFALDLARERDANGQALSPETIALAANAYALLAAGEEMLGEAFFLSLLKPLGLSGTVGKEGVRGFIRSAVKRAALDKGAGMAFLDGMARFGANALSEGLEESAQEATSIFVEYLAKGYANQAKGAAFENELFTRENAAQIGEAFKGGAIAGAWLGGGPIVVSTAIDVRSGRMAQAYSENLMALYDKVEASSTRQLSPAHMQSALEFSGEAMRESVALPADAALELYQSGTDILSPLGITEEQAIKAAAQGQDFLVPVSRLPAYLDRQQMEAATQILRRAPDDLSAAEAARLDERVAQDAAKVVELFQSQAAEIEAMVQEREALHTEVANVIQSIPGLKAQVENLGGGVEQYVGDWLNTVERFALRMVAAGQNPVETFRRVAFTELRLAQSRTMPTSAAIGEDLAAMQPGARGVSATAADSAIVHTGVESVDDLYSLASQSKDDFQSGITSIAEATGGQPLFRPGDGLKGRARAEEKILRDYPEIGAKRVLDILGGTILYDSRADVEAALPEIQRLVEAAGGEIVRGKDRFDKPSSGYKDYLLNIRQPNGLITELLLTTNAMNQAKTEGVGHLLYEADQKIFAVLTDPNATEEVKKEAKRIRALLVDASEAYYGSTGDQSNATASLSGIVEPLNSISEPAGSSSAVSSLYGELESLLGNIRNKLPSVANTNGLSSNSMNFLTNTGELGPSDSQGIPTASRPSMNRAINSAITEPPSDKDNIAQDEAQNKDTRKVTGSETAILLGEHGEQKARYEVRELADVIPSHDPQNQFAKREDYPDNVQERPYHSDAGEQDKVRGNALRLDPRLVVNNNPDLTNGPPAITENGIVLGGNSRAMSIQLAYANNSERAQMYRNAIAEQADSFGLDASAVAGMENPILVRVVEGGATADMGKLARLYNQTMMQGLQGKAEGVSKARMISPETLEVLASDMADFDSLRVFFDSASSKRFMAALLRDGVLEQTQLSRLTEKNGRLNDTGKTLVENALRGMIVPDYDILSALPASTLNKLDRVIPALAKLRARGEGWDMSGVVTAALRQVANANGQGKKVDVFLAQGDLLETDPDKNRPAVQALALTFANATQKEVQARFELMAQDSARQSKGQNLLVAMPENTPAQSFQTAFLETIASVDGYNIASFSPQHNQAHAALEYAYANGGKGHSINAALEKLQKTIARKNATTEQKAEAREIIRLLSQFSGSVAMYQPKLGTFFRRQPGQELFHAQEDGALGSTKIYPEGYLISLFQNANLSTLFHETGHVFFEEMDRVVRSGAADQTMIRDYKSLLNWLGAKEGVPLSREQREKVARGFEAYLMEGKAPAEDLKGAFSRFRRWLLKIYTDAVNLDVELTDEVRGVFDRMLATEREIAATAARNELLDLTAAEIDSLGFTGTARNTLSGLMPKAREAATESLQEARDQNRKQRLAKYFKEGLDEVREEPVYRARSDMRKTPLDLQAVKDNYGEETAESLRKKTPGGFKNDGGIDPEIFALEHGFESGTDMITQMLNAPSQTEAVRQRVQEKEARHDAAYEAFEHLLETREVAVQMEMVGRKLAELLNVDHIEREAYMRAARQELSMMPLGRAMQTGNFLAAMRRALRQEREAINAGDRKTALEAHRKAMLNMEFVRESRDIARRQGVIERQIKRFIGMAKGDPDARFIVMDIGMRHGLNKFDGRLAEGRDTRTIQSWLAAADKDGYSIFPDDRVLFGKGAPWREMSVADFESLAETVAQIVTVERNRRQIQTAQGKQDLEDVADSIAANIYTHRNAKALKIVEKQPAAVKGLKGLHAIHTKIEALCIALDGDNLGVAWEFIYKPINDAEDRQNVRFRTMRDALRGSNLFGAYARAELAAMGGKRELVQEVGEKLTHENRLAVALNMGNEVNISRIREGNGWNDSQIGAVLRTLTKRDWEFVQSVWDYIGTFKDEAFALQEQITGLRPTAVEAQAFTVQTADGHTLNLQGGYYPIKYDSEKGFLAFQREQRELDKELFGGRNYGAAMTKNGHLKERAEGGAGTPLLLELSVITDHLFNTVHDLEYRRAVLDVAKVIRHKTVREAIESTVGREMYRELLPWLQDVAQERQEPMHQIHRWARWARASASIMQMGYKVTTMLAQPMGFTQSIELLGYKDAAAGLKRVYGNPLRLPELLEETFARSTFMENRIKSFDREVRDFTKQLKPGMSRFGWVEKAKENAFVPMGMFQMSVDLPTWWGAYQKGLRENGGNEVQAAQYADSVVRMSQGGGATKDLARVQRGGDLLRMFTMFYSYFNTMYNLGARRISLLKQHHSPKDIFLAANTALLLWFVPAVLSELVAGRGPDAEGEEPEEWLLMNLLQYPLQSVIGVRDVANAIFGNYGYQITPAQSAPKALVQWFRSVNKALEAEDAGELVKPTAEAAGYLLGLPMKQPIITVGNLWDYITGEDPDFEVRDLFFVKPKGRQ